jgi:hypothetical protein
MGPLAAAPLLYKPSLLGGTTPDYDNRLFAIARHHASDFEAREITLIDHILGGSPLSKNLLKPADLRRQDFKALVEAPGWSNAVRLPKQHDLSQLVWTQERHQCLPD